MQAPKHYHLVLSPKLYREVRSEAKKRDLTVATLVREYLKLGLAMSHAVEVEFTKGKVVVRE